MAHQSLYRKYRPQTFGDVVGQEHIERTLKNAVADGTVAHAYLFTGPRGTGKTTTARILAKALNCQLGPTAEPDGTCEDCIEIAEGRHPDVYELDAASRTGVDNVREEIIGRVNFAPTRGRYKVYIIDEVHMLSTAAFNALLKTLEEPPSHVVFVMATTHPHKVPETIQSRCQRFDFRRISIDDIAGRLRVICDGEGFDVPDAALSLIARHAAGGMRDAITTLEQLASFTGGNIKLEDVEGLLGEVDTAQLFEIASLISRRDIAGCFRWVARFAEEGTDLAEFVRELTGHVRNLYVIAAVGDGRGIVDAGADEIRELESQATEFGGPDRLARMLDMLGELGAELRWSSDPRLSLEVAFTRMARPQGEMTLEAVAERVEVLERSSGTSATGAASLRSGSSAGALAPSAPTPPAESSLRDAAPVAGAPAPDAAARSASGEAPVVAATAISPAATAAPTANPVQAPASAFAAKREATPQPASVAVEAHHTGGIDRASARRAWPMVVGEIKKLKAARGYLFANTEVDVDSDGDTLVVEFPADQSFALEIAEEPDMRELMQRALGSVLGFAPPIRFQLGKGAVRPVQPEPRTDRAVPARGAQQPAPDGGQVTDPGDPYDDGPPLDSYESDGGATHEEASSAARHVAAPGPQSDLELLLTQGLGAQIVSEHAGQADLAGADDQDDAAEPDSADIGSLDPELFDTDSGEGD